MDAIKSTAPAPPSTRESRGLTLYLDRGSEFTRVSRDVYLVPSCSHRRVEYLVDLNAGTCECFDSRERRHHCKHLYAARLYRAWLRRVARIVAPMLEDVGGDVEGL
jgi:hypothetical protein